MSNLVCVSRRYPLRSKTSNAARYKVYTRGDFSGFMNTSNLLHLRYLVSQALYWNLFGIRNCLHTSINLGASHIHAGMVIWQFAGYVRQWFYPQTGMIAREKFPDWLENCLHYKTVNSNWIICIHFRFRIQNLLRYTQMRVEEKSNPVLICSWFVTDPENLL